MLAVTSGIRQTVGTTRSKFPPMPLYFFNVTRDGKPASINDGLELVDDQDAWEEATTACGELIREIDGSLRPGSGWKMEVTDAQGKPIYVLTFQSKAL